MFSLLAAEDPEAASCWGFLPIVELAVQLQVPVPVQKQYTDRVVRACFSPSYA